MHARHLSDAFAHASAGKATTFPKLWEFHTHNADWGLSCHHAGCSLATSIQFQPHTHTAVLPTQRTALLHSQCMDFFSSEGWGGPGSSSISLAEMVRRCQNVPSQFLENFRPHNEKRKPVMTVSNWHYCKICLIHTHSWPRTWLTRPPSS